MFLGVKVNDVNGGEIELKKINIVICLGFVLNDNVCSTATSVNLT